MGNIFVALYFKYNMPKEILKDRRGRAIGFIRERNGRLEIYGSRGQYLGKYDPRHNTTHNSTGERIGYGNLLTMLLCKEAFPD